MAWSAAFTAPFPRVGYRGWMVDDNALCYLHTDRRAAVGCQRCDQPICSSCMKSASVGFHCPACTKSGAQKVLRPGDLGSKPTMVYAIIGVCVVAFLGQSITGEGSWSAGDFYREGVLFGPYVQIHDQIGRPSGQLWRIVTSGFLHAGILHLAFNMYALFIFGPEVQRAVGSAKTVLIYAGGLFGGSAAVLLFNWDQPTLGASGAVLGLAGGLAGILWSRGINITKTPLGTIFLINLALPLFTSISFWGHFGGIAGGFAVASIMAAVDQRPRPVSSPGESSAGSPALVAGGVMVVALLGLAVLGAQLGLSSIL